MLTPWTTYHVTHQAIGAWHACPGRSFAGSRGGRLRGARLTIVVVVDFDADDTAYSSWIVWSVIL